MNRRSGRFKNELVKSLRTNDQRTAERAALPLIEEAHRLVDLARKSITDGPPAEIAPATIDALADAHTARLMRNDEALRRKGLGLDLDTGAFSPDGGGMTDGDIAAYRQSYPRSTSCRVMKLQKCAAVKRSRIINKSVEDAGIVLHPDDPAWRQLKLAFIKAQRKAVQAITARLGGEEIASPAPHESSATNNRSSELVTVEQSVGSEATSGVNQRSDAGRAEVRRAAW
ncbi:hypothetical protein [Mesorhizobium loti]|uniref:hypothetical protein n=1 Tax=Rhizobium loti TaxID=381 RepID=UPI0012BCD837|nr:hypothetical protein [Mesorhizobium loti]